MQHERSDSKVRPATWVAPMVAERVEATGINKFHTKAGYGFSAEDANILNDRLHFRNVENVGVSNSLDGADRIVNGVPIQTKYCKIAKDTVESAFREGKYRYEGQRLEVPHDQYKEAIKLMQEKILLGQIDGVTDPSMAESMITQGSVTYRQARNIARAGTVDGLVYDLKSHSIGAAGSLGISFTLDFAIRVWNGESIKDAIKESILTGLISGAITMSVGITTSQILRTQAAAVGRVWARDAVKLVYESPCGKVVIKKIAELSLGKSVDGGAAINHVAKLARSNAITTAATAVIVTAPDVYRAAVDGAVSWPQVGKNFSTTVASSIGGIGCGYSFGAAGAAIGTFIAPGPGTAVGGTIGSIIGMLAGSSAASGSTKMLLDLFVEDDAYSMKRLLNAELREFFFEYLLTEAEQNELFIFTRKKIDAKFLRMMYASTSRGTLVTEIFVSEIERIVAKRQRVFVTEASINEAVASIIDNIEVEAISA